MSFSQCFSMTDPPESLLAEQATDCRNGRNAAQMCAAKHLKTLSKLMKTSSKVLASAQKANRRVDDWLLVLRSGIAKSHSNDRMPEYHKLQGECISHRTQERCDQKMRCTTAADTKIATSPALRPIALLHPILSLYCLLPQRPCWP